MSVLERPQPRPGVLDIEAYVPGKSSAPGVAKVFKLSSNETPLGASPKAIAGLCGGRPASRGLSGRLPRPTCARRSAARSGSIPIASSAAQAPTISLNLLARAYLNDGDEAIHTTHGFLVYPIATLGAGATPVVARGDRLHRRRRRDPRPGDARAPRWCSSPTRTTRPAPTFRSTRSSACTRDCRRTCCW